MLQELNSFFNQVSNPDKRAEEDWEDLIYILSNELSWTQEDIYNTDIPFIYQCLKGRDRSLKKQAQQMKKSK